jgi:hypothetical protein
MRTPRPYPRAEPVTTEITFAALPTAVSCARLFVRHTLATWRAEPIDAAETAVVELVTEAVEQTGIAHPAPAWSQLTHLGLIHVRLLLVEDDLIVEVRDGPARRVHSSRRKYLRHRRIELHRHPAS